MAAEVIFHGICNARKRRNHLSKISYHHIFMHGLFRKDIDLKIQRKINYDSITNLDFVNEICFINPHFH